MTLLIKSFKQYKNIRINKFLNSVLTSDCSNLDKTVMMPQSMQDHSE